MPRRAILVLLIAATTLSACGSSEQPEPAKPPSPEEQVRATALKILSTDDADLVCAKLVTDRLIADVYKGDRNECAKTQSADEPGTPKVETVTVDGTRATTAVSVQGGPTDGAGGTLEFAREGATWKLDRFGTDMLRSMFLSAIETTDSGALSVPQMKACMGRQVKRMSEKEVRGYLYKVLRNDPKLQQATLEIAEKCPDELAIYVSNEVASVLEEQGESKALVRCARHAMRTTLRLTRMAVDALKYSDTPPGDEALAALGLAVGGACSGL